LSELGLSFNKVPVDIDVKMNNYDEWYAKINPQMTVPSLKYGDQTLVNSREIINHLCTEHPDKDLMPFDESRREKVESYLQDFYAKSHCVTALTEGRLQQQSYYWLYASTRPVSTKLERMKANPELLKFAEAKIAKLEADKKLVQAITLKDAEQQLVNFLNRIDNDLSDKREFLVGNQYSLADVVATCLLARVYFSKQETIFTPAVQEYWTRMRTRNSFLSAPIVHQFDDFEQYEPFKAF
jgi:glutathione S-transferase